MMDDWSGHSPKVEALSIFKHNNDADKVYVATSSWTTYLP